MAKEGLKKVPNYLKNVTKSTAYAAVDVFKELTPSFSETMSTNADLVTDISNDIRNYKTSIKSTKQKLDSSDIGQAAKSYKKNIVDDLKTGKLYNKERDAEYVMKASGFDKVFSMDDMNFEDLDFKNDDTGVSKSITVNSLASTKANVETMYGVANSLGSIAINNTDYIVENQKNLNTLNMMTNYKFFDEINTRLADISSNVKSLLDYANGNVTEYFNKTLKYYDETITQTNKIVALNQEYTELFRNMYGKREGNGNNNEKDFHGDILNSGFNAKEYAKYVAHNFKQTYQTNFGGMMNIMGEDSNPLLAFAGSPLKFLPKMLAKKAVPKELQKALGGFDSTFKNFFASLLLKTSSESSKITSDSNPLKDFLAEHFGLKPEYEGSIDPGKYVKGTIPFDGITKQAIIEVIPTYLRKILSAMTGKDEKVYNYAIGRFVTSRNLETTLNDKVDESYDGFKSKFDIHNEFDKLGLKDKDRKLLDKDLNKFYQFISDNSYFFNPHKEKYDDMTINGLSLEGGEGSFNSILSAMLNLPKEKIMEFNSDIYQVKKNRKSYVDNINKELGITGMGALKNNSEINDSVGKIPKSTDISKTVDKYDKNVFDYLRDIRTILLEGIKTYSFDVGKVAYKRNRNKMGTYDNLDDRLQRYKEEAKSFRENIPENIAHLKEQKGLSINDLTNMGVDKIKDKMNPKKKTDLKESANELIKDTRLSGTLTQIKDYTESIIKSPAKLATSVVTEVDKKMYDIIYGTGEDENAKIKGSFFSAILDTIKQKVADTANWFNDKFLQPLTEKMLGKDGLITKLNASVSSKFKMGVSKGTDFIFGSKNEFGDRTGGFATPIYNNIMDMTSYINNFFTGKGFKSKTTGKEIKGTANNVLSTMKSYMGKTKDFLGKSLFGEKEYATDTEGNVVLTGKRKNDGILTRTIDSFRKSINDFSLTLFGESSMKDGMGKFYNQKISQHLPHIASGATLGAILSLITPLGILGGATVGGGLGFVHSSEKAKDVLFGKMGDDNKRVGSKFISKEFQEKFKKVAPSVAGLGLLGAGSSILLPGGPLMWSFLGGGLGVAKESENFQKWMFGDNHKQRMDSIKNNFNKYAPSMLSSAGIGAGASIFLPGGPLMWSFLGAGLGFVKESEKTKEFLFGKSTGDGGYEHFSKEYQEKFKKAGLVSVASYMGTSMLQSGLGTLGSFLLPGGPVGAGIVALTAGIVSQSDKFKTFLFGEYDEEKHKREGGLLGKLKTYIQFEIFEPLKITVKGYTEKARHWFMTNIANPFKDSLQPLKKQFSIMGQTVKDSIIGSFKQLQFTAGSIFEKYVGKPFGEVLNKHVLDPIKKFTSKLFGGIGKLVGGILSAPVKGLNALAMTFLDKHRRDGVADYYEDWKKNKDSRDKKEKNKHFKNMKTINNMRFNYEDDVLEDLRKYGFDPSKPEVKLALARYHNMVKSGKIKDGNQGLNYKGPKKKPIEDINQTGFDKVNGTITEILSMLKNIFPFASKKNNSSFNNYKSYYHMPKRNTYRTGKTTHEDEDDYDDSYSGDISGMGYTNFSGYNNTHNKKNKNYKNKRDKNSRNKKPSERYYNIPYMEEPTAFSEAAFTEENSKSISSIETYTKNIRDEVNGQFDGVGYNVEKISNILTEQFGEPSIMPGLFKGSRGNKKGKGIFGKFKNFLVDLIRKPTDFLKNLFAKPIQKVNAFVTGVFSKVGKAVDAIISIPGKILNIFTNITDIVATAIRPIGELIMGSIQVGFDLLKFTIGEFASSLKGIGKGIGNVFEGLGKVVGSTISTVASFGESMGKIAFDILPRVVHATLDFVSFLGKTAKNTVTAGFRFAQNMFTKRSNAKTINKMSRNDIYISGGKLDAVKSIEGSKIDKIIDIISSIKNCACSEPKANGIFEGG